MERIAALKREAANDSSVTGTLFENLRSTKAYPNGIPPLTQLSDAELSPQEIVLLVRRKSDDCFVNPDVNGAPRRDGDMKPTQPYFPVNTANLLDQYAA